MRAEKLSVFFTSLLQPLLKYLLHICLFTELIKITWKTLTWLLSHFNTLSKAAWLNLLSTWSPLQNGLPPPQIPYLSVWGALGTLWDQALTWNIAYVVSPVHPAHKSSWAVCIVRKPYSIIFVFDSAWRLPWRILEYVLLFLTFHNLRSDMHMKVTDM